MSLIEQKINKLLSKNKEMPVYCFYSTEEYLLNTAAGKAVQLLSDGLDAETTKIDGPLPDIEKAIAAAGTISFFATKRIVELSKIDAAAMLQNDIDALCDIMGNLENACLVITCLLKDEKAKAGKKVKKVLECAKKQGLCEELIKPTDSDLRDIALSAAKALGAELMPSAAVLLIERCKNDALLLENETAKLAALANYGIITEEIVLDASTLNIEADVFEMVRFVSAKNKIKAFEILNKLLRLQNEPVAVAAAVYGSFIDAYRVKCAVENGKTYSYVFKNYGYTGSDYRLKKAAETAAKYSRARLLSILQTLLELDLQLKSSAVDNILLLQTALCEIIG